MERQSVLEQATDLPPVLTVAVANREEVAMLQAHDVRRRDVGVLVRLVRIVRGNAAFCREREFSDDVTDLVLAGLLRDLLSRRGRVRYLVGRRRLRTILIRDGAVVVGVVLRTFASLLPDVKLLLQPQFLLSLHALQALRVGA